VLDKTKGTTNLSFQDWSVIRTTGFVEIKNIGAIEVTSDSTHRFVIKTLGQPNIVVASLYNERDAKQILITPGDTLFAVIDFKENKKDRFEVIFNGRNEENYNAYYDLNKEFDRDTIMKLAKSVESLEKYIQIIDNNYSSNTKKINEILKPSVLKDLMLNEEKACVFQYLDYRKQVSKEKLSKSYLLSIKNRYFPDKIVCENPLYMKSYQYTIGMGYLKDLLCEGITDENQFIAATDTIEKYFAGELKDYLIATSFNRAINKYKKNKELNATELDHWYYDNSAKITGNTYAKFIQFSYDNFRILNNPFPENVLIEKIIQLSDSSVYTLCSFLEKYKGAQLVIDNWATWCGPCLHEMMVGKENIQKLKELGNTFVYISMDEIHDFKKAKKKAIELGIIKNAYLIPGNFKTAYARYFSISEIPRYIMIDVNGNVKNSRMPYPSNISNFFDYRK